MRGMKRILAMLLAVVMVVGLIPATVFAAETVLDAAIFCSDVHGSTSDLTSVLAGVKTSGVDYSSIGFVGDTCLTVANTTSTVQSALGDTDIAVMFSYAASHDTENSADIADNWDYSGEVEGVSNYYLVYTIRETDMQNSSDAATAAPAFTSWYNGLTAAEKALPIFIMSHRPLHDRRDDNAGAATWYDAISAAAESSDIVFFWAHNHTSESSVDTAAYYVAKDGTETFTVYNGDTVTPNFTYMNAGYINANGQHPARINVATTVQITADSLIFQDYTTSGTYTDASYSHNVTVAREFAASEPAATLESIEVSGTTEYTVGGNGLDLTVTATYDDGTTADVTEEATFEPAELTASGEYTVTASYGEMTDTIDVTVNLYDEVLAADGETLLMGVEAFSQGATALKVTWDDAADAVLEAEGLYTDYVVYDLAVTNPGETTTYSMTLVDNMDTTNLAVYHVAEDGTLTAVPYTIENDCVVFTTSLTGAFAYGNITVPDGYTLQSVTLANIPTDLFVGGSLDLTEAVITATYTKEGAEDFVRQLTVYDYDESNFSGYDVNVAGPYTAVFTFEGVTATLDIHVWGHEFTSGDVTVSVDNEGSEYGVTNVNVATSTNANVADAIQYVIEGDNYVAYDITLTYENGYSETEDAKTVTLPIPEGVTNPVVYYVPTSGNAVPMNATNNGDGTVSFETTHFSTYVLGDGTTIETENGDATTEGTEDVTTITKVAEEITVYKLVTSPESGKTYLIVNSNNGNGYGLDGDTTGYSTTAFTGGSDYYSTWDDTSKTGTAFAAGSDVYLTTSSAYLWEAGSNSFTIGYTQNSESSGLGGLYGGGSYTYDLNPSGNGGNWTVTNNQLKINLQVTYKGAFGGGSETYADYYLTNSDSTWGMATSGAANVYFYEPVTIYKVTEQETTIPGDVAHTYSTEGTDITDAVAINGQTVTLNSVLYDTPKGGTQTDITASSGWTATYELTEKGNPNVITSIDGNVATLSGVAGTAVVKVTYTSADGTLTAWDEFIVTANNVPDENYTIDLTDGAPNYNSITEPITIKGVMAGMQTSVWAVVKAGEHDLGNLGNALTWSVSNPIVADIDTTTGIITFTGEEGEVEVTVYYTCPGGRVIQDTVKFSVTVGGYTVPGDGTNDFPEYPNEGAIRFDKHATAVGNFSETGITQVELSMTGVPYSTGSEIDVVVMLDMTGSMSDNGMEAAEEATKAFVKLIVTNEDGTYNKNRVAVYAFNSGSSSPYELVALDTIDSDAELETANTAIDTASDKQASGGTPYDEATQKCHDVLAAAKTDGTGNNRQQFCVFMSDGGPTSYYGSDEKTYYNGGGQNSSGDVKIESVMTGYSSSDSTTWEFNVPTEYWTDDMKADGVTVYTVGLLLQTAPNNPSPYSSMTDSTYDSETDSLTTIGSHYYFCSNILKQMASDESKYIDIFNVDNASNATAKFESIAKEIREAATDVTVTDKITSDYTMVFEAPNTSVADALPAGQEMYIEVKDYVLNPVYTAATGITEFAAGITYYTKGTDGTYTEVTGSFVSGTTYYTITDYTRGTSTSLVKLYLGKSGTTYYAASDANGTAYAAPTFNQTAIGTMYYWTTTADTSSGVSVTVDGTTYYFVAAGISNKDEDFVAANWYNMASGAYASGNIETVDILDANGKDIGDNSTCNDLIIATPHFVYNASTKMLVWTAEKLSTSELTLTYFLYLDKSGGYSGAQGETDPGTYETNEYAYLNYTNFQGTECQQTMPVPQMTWNGAQVSYVFYLVNEAGQPVNRAGKVVPFSEAVYVTDVHTYSIVWNDLEQVASLEAAYLAEELVPEIYELYDNGATYNIHVFEDEEGQNLNNHFVIGSGLNTYTTYVFNNKSDATKYKVPGAYAAATTYKCKEYVEGGQYTDDKGAYNIVSKSDATAVETGFDFSNTTVAFAVVWRPELQEDVVVIDFGLDVVVNVITNDAMAAGVVGVRADQPYATINSGTYDAAKSTTADIYIDANNDGEGLKELKIGTATVASLTSVRFSLDETNGMQFNKPAVFYYETDVNYYIGSELKTTSMYSSVTVIPATTVYYEDTFVTYTGGNTEWTVEGTTSNKTQAVDRPGVNKLSDTYDADNVYGYDAAYDSVSTYSMGSAHKIHVDANSYGNMEFSFWGTGFDVISMTSSATGTLVARIFDADGNRVANKVVDTYYGYNYGWCKVTYTYTLVEEAKEATDATEATEAVYSWVKTNYVGADAEGTNEEKPEDPQEGAQYTAYEYGWYPCADENALYQVPVIQANGLDYGYYKVTIIATYAKAFDHTADDGYDLYLDAIRIYDPTGDLNASANDAYKADNEANPNYTELRNNVISASNYQVTENEDRTTTVIGDEISGLVFIDGKDSTYVISDYVSYGPNNELYLAPGQAIAFNVTDAAAAKDVQLGIKLANGDSVTYEINGESRTVSTAADMYYSILKYAQAGTVVIENVSGGILSLTNIKVTYAPAAGEATSLLWMDGETANFALMSLRRAPADTDDSVSGDTTDTETEDTVTDGNTNTGNTTGDNTNTEVEDTVTGETNAPEVDNTVTEGNGADDTTTNEPAEDVPVEEIPEEDTPAEEETTEEPAEQLGFWARLWNAIKNAFNRLFSWFGF